MDKPAYLKGTALIGLLLITHPAFSANSTMPLRVNNYIIPAAFATALQQGMAVPVFIQYNDVAASAKSQQKIADAILSVKDSQFVINEIALSDDPGRTELAPNIKELITNLKDAHFDQGDRLQLNKDAALTIDTRSFYLQMSVNKEALVAATLPRSNMLGESTSQDVSNILTYTVGSYYNEHKDNNNSSSFITLDNTTSLREHHVNINGSIYGIGTADNNSELYRAMYERDYRGHRVALGMVDTWNLQSIASMSALNSSRIYGGSIGNKSSTIIEDNTLTLIPITVFLPAAGEVHVIRNGKLLSIQNFSMGSYEIDTSHLPFGIYNVDIQVIVNGKIVNSRSAQINKTFSRESSVTGNLDWQTFAGMLEYNKTDYRHHNNIDYGKQETWVAGLAAGTTWPILSGINIKSTLYGFDTNGVSETEANIIFNDFVNLNQQLLLATDDSWQSISSVNISFPEGYGNIWGSRQFGYVGSRLPMQQGDYFTIGANTNLNRFIPWLGTLSISRTNDKYDGNKYTNLDYNQTLFSNRWVTASLRAGIQRYNYSNERSVSDKYINLDLTLPFSSWFSAGVSSEQGNLLANATLRKNFDEGVISQAGASLSQRLRSSHDDNGYQSDKFSANGYLSYDTKYNAGTVSISRSSEHNANYNLSSQGSIAWSKESFNIAKGNQRAGVVINTGFTEKGQMLAQINGHNYPLTGKSNFISLPPFSEYKVELMNDKTSEDSVDIVSGRRSQVILYPGNVTILNPKIKQLVTVFGRMHKADGAVYANAEIYNHIGKTRTDERGEFAMDVDKRFPVISLIDNKGGICEADLDLHDARGAVWMGSIRCTVQDKMASLREGKQDVY